MTASRGKGSSKKGKNFELGIAHKLSDAYKINVNRVPMSGAWRGSNNNYALRDDSNYIGDLFFPSGHPLSIFNYELKNHAGIKLRNFFMCNSEIPQFMQQVTTDSYRIGGVGSSIPCLIVHVEREDDYVAIPYEQRMYEALVKEDYPAMELTLGYTDERTQVKYQYQMLLTNLKSFTAIDPIKVNTWYYDLDWDILNDNTSQEQNNSEVDKFLEGIED